jgi:hypothetical protein
MDALPVELVERILEFATGEAAPRNSYEDMIKEHFTWYDNLRLVSRLWRRLIPVRSSILQLLPKLGEVDYSTLKCCSSVTRDNMLARHDLPWKSSSINEDATIEEILQYPKAAWDWNQLTRDVNIDDIGANPHLPWNMKILCSYSNFRELAKDYPRLKWELLPLDESSIAEMIERADPEDDWRQVTVDVFPASMLKDDAALLRLCKVGVWQNISKYIQTSPATLSLLSERGRTYFGRGLSRNPSVTTAHVLAAPDIEWFVDDLYVREDIDFGALVRVPQFAQEIVNFDWDWEDRKQLQVLTDFPNLEWDWDSITFDAEIRFMLENLHLPWNQEKIRRNFGVKISDILSFPNFDWDWSYISTYIDGITLKVVADHPDLPWDYSEIFSRDYYSNRFVTF